MPNIRGNRNARSEKNGYNKRRQKNPQRKNGNGNGVKLPTDVIRQNKLRARMRSISKQLSLRPVREVGTGVDYKVRLSRGKRVKHVQIDIKFSFGLLGDNVIKVRMNQKRRLINDAEWAFAIDRNNMVHVFPMSALEQYVRQHFGRLSAQHKIDRGTHFEYPVKLEDMYAQIGISPHVVPLSPQGIQSALDIIKETVLPKLAPTPLEKRLPVKSTSKIERKITPIESKLKNGKRKSQTLVRRGNRGK